MDYFERHVGRPEAALEELSLHPDHVIHETYYAYALQGCLGLEDLAEEERRKLLHKIELACVGVFCPPLAVGASDTEVHLLVQGNPEISMDGIAQAAGSALGIRSMHPILPFWNGDYAVISLAKEEANDFASAFHAADQSTRNLFLRLGKGEN